MKYCRDKLTPCTVQSETEAETGESSVENMTKVASSEGGEQTVHNSDNTTEKAAGFNMVTSAGNLTNILGSLLTAVKTENRKSLRYFKLNL
jgi:hypothetical protein